MLKKNWRRLFNDDVIEKYRIYRKNCKSKVDVIVKVEDIKGDDIG